MISYFDQHFVKTSQIDKKFSKIFHQAKDLRETSDYETPWQATVTHLCKNHQPPRGGTPQGLASSVRDFFPRSLIQP